MTVATVVLAAGASSRLGEPKALAIIDGRTALEYVLDGAFAGAGDTLPPLLVGLPLTAARVPLAWFFAHPMGLGVDGIWIAITISTMAKGILLALWFRRGRWKLRDVG